MSGDVNFELIARRKSVLNYFVVNQEVCLKRLADASSGAYDPDKSGHFH